MPANTLQDLYVEKLQDLLSAEQQILEALPQMIQKTSHPQLRQGFEAHLRQTQEQSNRIQQLLQQHGAGEGKKCEGMAGIIREGQMTMKEVTDSDALDALLIAAAQSVEHYEMAGYGTARTWARELGPDNVTVNVVAPGWIPVERHGEVTAEDRAGDVAEVPLRRMGTPQEIADVVAFVASDASRFVTGERITVNGGHTID